MSDYDYVLTAAAAHTVLGSAKRLRQQILTELELLAQDPFAAPDLEETGASGRKFSIRVRERIVFTYWVDHAVREVRVIRVEIC